MTKISPLELARNKRYAKILEIALLRKLADTLDDMPADVRHPAVLLPALTLLLITVARNVSDEPQKFRSFTDISAQLLKAAPWKDHGA